MAPTPGHDTIALAYKQGYAEVCEQIPRTPARLLASFDPSMMATEVYFSLKDSDDNNKHPDAIPGVKYNNLIYVLGPVEVGNTQPLHGGSERKLGVLETVSVSHRCQSITKHKLRVVEACRGQVLGGSRSQDGGDVSPACRLQALRRACGEEESEEDGGAAHDGEQRQSGRGDGGGRRG